MKTTYKDLKTKPYTDIPIRLKYICDIGDGVTMSYGIYPKKRTPCGYFITYQNITTPFLWDIYIPVEVAKNRITAFMVINRYKELKLI